MHACTIKQHVCIYMCVCVCSHMSVYVRANMCVCVCMCVCMCLCVYVHALGRSGDISAWCQRGFTGFSRTCSPFPPNLLDWHFIQSIASLALMSVREENRNKQPAAGKLPTQCLSSLRIATNMATSSSIPRSRMLCHTESALNTSQQSPFCHKQKPKASWSTC